MQLRNYFPRAWFTARSVASGLLALTTLSALALGLNACQSAPRSVLQKGSSVFLRACSGCHGPDGRGGSRPGFVNPPRDLTDAAYMAQLTDENIRSTLRNGKGQMPAFGALLEEDEVASLIAFLRTLPATRK